MIRDQRLVPHLTAFLITCGLMVATAMPARGDFFNATDAAIGTFALSSGSPSWVDYNKDGYLDLGDGLHIMENEGPGPTGQYTLKIKPNPIGDGLFGDYDKDGWVDYFMPHVGELYHSNSGQIFTLV